MTSQTIRRFLLLLIGWCCFAAGQRWNNRNDPRWWWYTPQDTFSSLPLSGSTPHAAWSGTYWPNKNGGIAHRWVFGEGRGGFNYTLHTMDDLQKMSENDLKTLSPAEKYDIFTGRLDYPTVRSEWRRTTPDQPHWYGLCHGWAPASILYKEPHPVTLAASSNISIPFGSSDVKALLVYFLAQVCTLCLQIIQMNQPAHAHRCHRNRSGPSRLDSSLHPNHLLTSNATLW